MKELNRQINEILMKNGIDRKSLEPVGVPMYPFNEVEHVMAYMLGNDLITYGEYRRMYEEYKERNRYLPLFDESPRTFGETWGEMHIRELFPQFVKENRQHRQGFSGEYDLLLDGIRVEVKACRANDVLSRGNLSSRAYLHSEATAAGFRYHFQQIKTSCCDVFIWIGVCRDELLYWVLSGDDVKTLGLSSQHRNENSGSEGDVFEGQVFATEDELEVYRVDETDIQNAVLKKAGR